ncbi:VanZ family protein [Microbacterium sp. cf046]|uniref:VanZ family protein n=1 Tax=Microbacterium sp. cf046 TaxID=1761803 RepID=UPI000B84E259|nr:VanZ family protein [Microbacterium sp. cf046]
MTSADAPDRRPRSSSRAIARALLTVYAITLALIAFWPVPVDSDAGPLLRQITLAFPPLTYPRIELLANILLFVPLGALLMLIIRRRYLILPIAVAVTAVIECSQALMLDRRTPSMLDIIANTVGACVGILIVAALQGVRRREADHAVPRTVGARSSRTLPPSRSPGLRGARSRV